VLAGASKSVIKNFFLALAYTLGMATMFAVLGLVVTSCGVHCGQLLINPIFVVVLVCFLAYLGFSMFGLYDMYIPRFLQPRQGQVKRGSWISAFFFGIVSGTIASPCMSPGLALLLSIVTGLGNKLVGFLLLFVFGIGSSIPLLIIGTFSSSLQVLPRAGMWMVEVKKVFGFMLISICFYYLQNILPLYLVLWLGAVFFVLCGLYCLGRVVSARTLIGRLFALIMGMLLTVSGVYGFYSGYKQWHGITEYSMAHATVWRADYTQAIEQAIQSNTKILLDFGADWCSLCTQLERRVLHTSDFITGIKTLPIIALKIDGTVQSSEPYASLMKEFNIVGLPTVILLDPQARTVIKRWHSELLQRPIHTFIEELGNLTSK